MLENHQQLVEQYKETGKIVNKSTTKTVILEAFVVVIVCGMKAIQARASLALNIIATTCVGILFVWHFWGFRHRRAMDKKTVNVILEGLELEKQHPFLGQSFFRDYLKKFNVIGEIARMALFDFIFIYFFSISITQLLKSINPEIVTRLAPSALIRTLVITSYLGWVYYRSVKPLIRIQKTDG